ncbi:MAG: response regulator transcription factor [Sphingomonadales bacterium]|nr:MAG: response regulator transcription factor [Sphingomonadales bacterium]
MMARHKILIVDGHPIIHAGLRQLFSPYDRFEIVAALDRGAVVSAYLQSQLVDLVILDLEMADVRGIDILAEIVGALDMTVIVMTNDSRNEDVAYALKLGARAVVSKAGPNSVILEACEAALAGETYVAPDIAAALSRNPEPPVILSSRQMAILHYVAEGETNKEIGYRMALAPPTIAFHIAELRRRFDAANNRKLIDRAQTLGLI